jgi:MFS family permease
MERSLFVFNSLKLRVARSPLRSPAFLRLWLGLSISYVGDQFTTIALLWFVLQLTGSGVAISLVLLCFQLPSMVTGPLLGVILDRWQPRVVMGIDNCARALLIGVISEAYEESPAPHRWSDPPLMETPQQARHPTRLSPFRLIGLWWSHTAWFQNCDRPNE